MGKLTKNLERAIGGAFQVGCFIFVLLGTIIVVSLIAYLIIWSADAVNLWLQSLRG